MQEIFYMVNGEAGALPNTKSYNERELKRRKFNIDNDESSNEEQTTLKHMLKTRPNKLDNHVEIGDKNIDNQTPHSNQNDFDINGSKEKGKNRKQK